MRSAAAALAWFMALDEYPLDEDGDTQCMRAVLQAYDLIPIGGYNSAMHGWALDGKPGHLWLPGTPVYFKGPFGHVALTTGVSDLVRSTGIHSTKMFTAPLAEVARLSGDPYLGHATSFSGRPIDFTGSAGGGATPIGEEMELTDRVKQGSGTDTVNDYLYYMYRDIKAVNVKADALTAAVSTLALGAGLDPDKLVAKITTSVDAALKDDFASMAAKISQTVDTFTPAELAALAKAVQDEEDRRERVRLGGAQ